MRNSKALLIVLMATAVAVFIVASSAASDGYGQPPTSWQTEETTTADAPNIGTEFDYEGVRYLIISDSEVSIKEVIISQYTELVAHVEHDGKYYEVTAAEPHSIHIMGGYVALPSTMKVLKDDSIEGGIHLNGSSIKINDQLVSIGSRTLAAAGTYIALPATVNEIKSDAFGTSIYANTRVVSFNSQPADIAIDAFGTADVIIGGLQNHSAFDKMPNLRFYDHITNYSGTVYELKDDKTAAILYAYFSLSNESEVIDNGEKYTVTEIAENSGFNLMSIEIPSSVISIANNAINYTSVKCLNIPANVKKIGDNAFNGSDLHDIVFYGRPDSIGIDAFPSYEDRVIKVHGDVADLFKSTTGYAFDLGYHYADDGNEYVVLNDNEVLFRTNESAMEIMSLASTVTMNNREYTVIGIAYNANWNSCEKICLPETIRILEDRAFYNNSIKVIKFSTDPTEIGSDLFNFRDTKIEGISDPTLFSDYPDVTFIAESVEMNGMLFTILESGVTELTSVYDSDINVLTLPDSVTDKNGNKHNLTKITAELLPDNVFGLIIPESVEYVDSTLIFTNRLNFVKFMGTPTVDNYSYYLSVDFYYSAPENFSLQGSTSIKCTEIFEENGIYYANKDNSNNLTILGSLSKTDIKLTSSVIHDLKTYTATEIGDGSFIGILCKKLTIPNTITEIGRESFTNTGLKSITIPVSVKYIGIGSFRDGVLETAYIKNKDVIIGAEAFNHNEGLYIIGDLTEANFDYRLPGCIIFKDVRIIDGVEYIVEEENGKLVACIIGYTGNLNDEVVIHDSIETDYGRVDVTVIYRNAFEGSNISKITLPSKLKDVGDGVFIGCKNLKELTIPASVQVLGSHMFDGSGINTLIFEGRPVTIGENFLSNDGTLLIAGNIKDLFPEYQNNPNYIFCDGYYIDENVTLLEIDSKYTLAEYNYDRWDTGKLTIPASYTTQDGKVLKISVIGKELFENCMFDEIIIPEGITCIGEGAFRNCLRLNSISIPQSVESIETMAFEKCVHMYRLVLPSVVPRIAENAFDQCPLSETALRYSDNMELAAMGLSDIREVIIPKGTTNVNSKAFVSLLNLEKITLEEDTYFKIDENGILYSWNKEHLIFCPSNAYGKIYVSEFTRYIDDYAFSGCSHITDISLPSGLQTIGKYGMALCYELGSIEIPETVTSIGEGAFRSCTRLTDIRIPSQVTDIPAYSFYGCMSLKNIHLSEKITGIGLFAISNTAIEKIEIPASVTRISDMAFSGTPLKEVVIRGTPTIGEYNFERGPVLSTPSDSVEIAPHNNYYTRDFGTYDGLRYGVDDERRTMKVLGVANKELTGTVTIPSCIYKSGLKYEIVEIGACAFMNDNTVDAFIIPNSVKKIGERAFYHARANSITLPSELTELGEKCLYNTGITSINIPSWINPEVANSAFRDNALIKNYTVDPNNAFIKAVDGVLFTKEGDSLVLFPSDRTGTYTIPDEVTRVYKYAFWHSSLTALNFGSGINTIWEYTVGSHTIEDITVSENLRTILTSAFCTPRVTEIHIPEQTSLESNIIDDFYDDHRDTVTLYVHKIPYHAVYAIDYVYVLNESEVYIDGMMFATDGKNASVVGTTDDFNVINLEIPSTIKVDDEPKDVTAIAPSAFKNCRALASVTIPNSIKSIGAHAFEGCGLKSIKLPDIQTEIGALAFADNEFETVQIPAWMKEYDAYFADNSLLTKFTVAEGNQFFMTKGGILYYCNGVAQCPAGISGEVVLPYGTGIIFPYAFSGCENMTSLKLPTSMIILKEYALNGCSSLTEIILPMNMVSVERNALNGCSSLKDIYLYSTLISDVFLPDKIDVTFHGNIESMLTYNQFGGFTNVGFADYSVLTTTFLGLDIMVTNKGATVVGINNMSEMPADLILPKDLRVDKMTVPITGLKPGAFKGATKLTSIEIPVGVTLIPASCFEGCDNLRSVVHGTEQLIKRTASPVVNADGSVSRPVAGIISEGTTVSIGDRAFFGCSALNNFKLSDNTITIGNEAFKGCRSLNNFVLTNATKSIGDNAFEGCESITSISLPKSLETVGKEAFKGCNSIGSIVIMNKDTIIDSKAFDLGKSECDLSAPDGFDKTQLGDSVEFVSKNKVVFEYIGEPAGTDRLPSTILNKGDVLQISVPAAEGYAVYMKIDGERSEATSVTMGERDITVTYVYEPIPETFGPDPHAGSSDSEELPIMLIVGGAVAVLALVIVVAVLMKRRS